MPKPVPHTDPTSSRTPHMSALRHHLERLRAAHADLHDHLRERVDAAALAYEERRPRPQQEEQQS